MGLFGSKIPREVPGQVLLSVGISEIDEFYRSLENSVKLITELKVEIDTRTTDLIKHLGATRVWEHEPDIDLVFNMILTVLAVIGNGYVNNAAILAETTPYITIIHKAPSRALKKVIRSFTNFMETVNSLNLKLQNCEVTSEDLAKSKKICKKIVKNLIKFEFPMKDKLTAIKIVNHNYKKIKSVPQTYTELLQFHSEIPEKVSNLFNNSSIPPFSLILLKRGIQATLENLTSPASIIQKFWPII